MSIATLDLQQLHLESGKHDDRTEAGEPTVCLMEAVAWYAGEDHGDMPACVSLALRSFGIQLNDALPDDRRQELKRFIPDLVGTRDDGQDHARAQLVFRWLMTVALPAWLQLEGMEELAEKARGSAAPSGDELRTAPPLPRRAAEVVAEQRHKVYWALCNALFAHYETSDTSATAHELHAQQLDSAIDLYDRMIHVGRDAA